MRVLYFGTYERDYPRNAQVVSALRKAGVDVVERNEPIWEGKEHKFGAGAGVALSLVGAQFKLLRRSSDRFDAVIVGYPGQLDMAAARWVAQGAPVVFNPMLSLADTLVHDRKRFAPTSVPGRGLRALDRYSFRLADIVVADTAAHARYFAELAGIPIDRTDVCFIGAEDDLFTPGWVPSEPIAFVGKFAPLQGLDTIIEAARIATDVSLRIVGAGQQDDQLEDLPSNVEWVGWVPYEDVPRIMRSAAGALGIFGTTDKAKRVIPNKAYQAIACGTPLITEDSPAARELFTDGIDALLVPPGDAPALAEAMRRLYHEDALARRIGDAGLATYRARASEAVLGQQWRTLVEAAIARKGA